MRYEFNQGGTESMWNNPVNGIETWENEYDVTIFAESGKSYKYNIEADTAGASADTEADTVDRRAADTADREVCFADFEAQSCNYTDFRACCLRRNCCSVRS